MNGLEETPFAKIRRLEQEALKQIDHLVMEINVDKERLHESELKAQEQLLKIIEQRKQINMYKRDADNWKRLYLQQLKLPLRSPVLKIMVEQCDDLEMEMVKGDTMVKHEVKHEL